MKIRAATEAERGEIEIQWRRCISPNAKRMPQGMVDTEGRARAQVPGHRMTLRFYRRMVRATIAAILAEEGTRVFVAESSTVAGRLFGWTVFSSGELFFVRVLPGYGKRQVGRSLVRIARQVAGGPLEASYMTADGRALLAAVDRTTTTAAEVSP